MGKDWRVMEPASSLTTKIRVVAAVVQRADQYLICQRPVHKRHGGLWEFPGGKLERGESVLEGARRELREELGVEVTEVGRRLFSIHDPGSVFEIEFHETVITGTPTCLEHQALAWATVAEMSSMKLAPSDQAFVRFLTEQQSTGA